MNREKFERLVRRLMRKAELDRAEVVTWLLGGEVGQMGFPGSGRDIRKRGLKKPRVI